MLRRPNSRVYNGGGQTRDYIYVDDVVTALLAAAETTATGPINVGIGHETDVLELVSSLRETGQRKRVRDRACPAPHRRGAAIAIDPSRAERDLGWRSKTGLEDGLRETLNRELSEFFHTRGTSSGAEVHRFKHGLLTATIAP